MPYYRPEKFSSASVAQADDPVICQTSKITLSTPNHYLNTLSIHATRPSPNAPPPAVLLHGYGAGLGFFFKNFPALVRVSSCALVLPQYPSSTNTLSLTVG